MSILINFHWKIRQLVCWLAFFFALTSFLAAQNCPTPTQLSKDSTTVFAVHFSWQSVRGASGYKVTYTTPTDTFSQNVTTNFVSFGLPLKTDFEIFTVSTICSNGDESEPSALIDGGIVITVDDIFRLKDDCLNPGPNPPDYLFFSDLCMYTHFNDLCQAINLVDPPDPLEIEKWIEDVLEELSTGNYLWEPWDNPDGCQEPLRLQKPVLSELKVSPNPFSNRFTAHFNLEKAGTVSISILDIMGRTLEKHQLVAPIAGNQSISDLGTDLPSGMYFLQIQTADQQLLINILKHE